MILIANYMSLLNNILQTKPKKSWMQLKVLGEKMIREFVLIVLVAINVALALFWLDVILRRL